LHKYYIIDTAWTIAVIFLVVFWIYSLGLKRGCGSGCLKNGSESLG